METIIKKDNNAEDRINYIESISKNLLVEELDNKRILIVYDVK